MTLACNTKDKPGGDACCLAKGHLGPHDWQGGRPEGERHAKDFFGRSLYVGDEVATLMPAYRYTLMTATVVRITPKMIRVSYEDTRYTVPELRNRETTVAECQVVKRCRP